MPISFKQAGSLFLAGPNINIYPSGNTFAISGSAGSTTITTLLGTGINPIDILDNNNNTYQITNKGLSAGTGIGIVEDTLNSTITFSYIGSSSGSTSGTSLGSGVNILFSSSTTNLAFATLSSQTPSTLRILSSSTGVILFSASTGGISGTYVSGITNISGGISPISGTIVNNNLVVKAITGAGATTVSESNGIITITSTGGSSTGITTASTVGGGVSLISAITSNNLQLNSISGTAGMVVNAASNGLITFRGPNTNNRVFVTDSSGNMINSASLQVDNTNNTLGINTAAATNSRLLLPASAAAMSQLRFTTSATDITSPTNGDVWYLTTGNSLKFYKSNIATDFIFKDNNNSLSSNTASSRVVEVSSGGTITASRLFQSFGIFNSITSTTISSTTSETSIIPTGSSLIGSATLLASTGTTPQLVTGKKYRFTANGNITTKSSPAGNLTARMKLGSSVIASISGFSLHPSIASPNNFFIQSTFTIRNASSGGTVVGSGFLQTDNNNLLSGATNIVGLNNLGQITVDCTSDKIFDFTFQFSTSDASNTITINEATLEYLN
jgi:hypothetical protein